MAGQTRERGSRASRKGRPVRAGPAAAASDPDPASGGDSAPRARDKADELEDRLLKRLEEAYAAALARLADLGHEEEAALEAVLRAGHCYGKLEDPVANIVDNARTYLSNPGHAGGTGGFADLRRLEEYSLAGLVCLLQSSRPTLTRAEAMWCLLSSDLRLEEAIAIGASLNRKTSPAGTPVVSDDRPPAMTDAAQRGCSSQHTTTPTAGPDPALFDPETFMKLAIRQGPANAAGVISCIKTSGSGQSRSGGAAPEGHPKESFAKKVTTEELIESVVSELEALDIDKKDPPDANPDPKNQMVRDLIKQTREMEAQLKERKEWAQGKAIQAARKLGTDLTELRVLRMEHDENQRRKKEKQVMEDDTLKRLAQLETELKKKSGQLDRSNATAQRLEMENAEIRAEMEAAKLSASETERQCQSLARKEKKDNKKLETWERQKAKLKEDIAECKTKITQAERELVEVNKAIKNMEIKIREDAKTKEENIALLEEERRKREAAKVNADRRLEELRRKKQVESQCYKDDLHRLQDELSRLQKSAGANVPHFHQVTLLAQPIEALQGHLNSSSRGLHPTGLRNQPRS
ncbi:hypothetical protein PR202_gb22781 [Eleusine coracana subsp. coracana]|uniref:PIR2-like helical domain-containing protein n=1 Tax=Eleusine coracana subsp. coracana TaxID=191504 RepID=A0AAV5FEK2_ELECO|nr:hypothetical protein PR202_gb22781 [Eleusine coracana subsp. coracana]